MKSCFLIVIGLGNIGSHIVPRLANLAFLEKILLVDPDRYTTANLESQDIEEQDVGRHKTSAQKDRLQKLNPGLKVEELAEGLESIPLGSYHDAGLVLSGLDSRLARMHLNERIFRVGNTAWIDTGVDAESRLVRVSVFPPVTGEGSSRTCFECSFSDADYRAVGVKHLCSEKNELPTGASSELGDLAAALALDELAQLNFQGEDVSPYEIHSHLDHPGAVTKSILTPNSACRFDHEIRNRDAVAPLDLSSTTIGQLFAEWAPPDRPCFRIATGGSWVRQLACVSCGDSREILIPRHRLPGNFPCRNCGEPMRPVGSKMKSCISNLDLENRERALSLEDCGFRTGDWLTFFSAEMSRENSPLSIELV